MTAISRLGDTSTGHASFPPKNNIEASNNVFINGKGVHGLGDAWNVHCDPDSCHDSVTSEGSPNVFVNGKAVGRIGDELSCGDVIAQGSENVFANK